MALHHRTVSRADGRSGSGSAADRLVLLHGFTQNVDGWGPFADRLANHADLVLVDAPGHGRSGHDDADLETAADLSVEAGGRGVYVGYSMGGRVALHAALSHPAAVSGLVLIGATAGLDDPADRADRMAADEALATRLEAEGLPAFLDRWLNLPLFAGLDEQAAATPARLRNRADGLAASLRRCGTGTQAPLWDRLAGIEIPVLVIAGADDHKFTALGHRLVASCRAAPARLVTIPGTHAVHLEAPEATAAAVVDHLRAIGDR
ncbi:MAG: alpha/beta fold hydrolase [Actinomycetota bacterium]